MIKMKTIMWFGFVLGALSAAGKVIVTQPGKKVMIECDVSSFNKIEWNHENNLIRGLTGSGFPRKGKGEIVERSKISGKNLEISKVKEEDAGKVTCVADGISQDHTLLVVSVSARPAGHLQLGSEATLQCQVRGLDPGSTVQWTRPGRPAESSPVQIKPVALKDAGTWECVFSHGGEPFKESLDIQVKEPEPKTSAPVNSQGSKDVIKPPTPDLDVNAPPSNTALLLGLSWWVWVAVGAGCLAVVLLTVFIIVLCQRIRRRKRKLQKMYDHQQLKSKPYCHCNRPAAAAKPHQGRRREKPSAPPLHRLLVE